MDWIEANRLRGAVVLDRTGKTFGTMVAPHVENGRVRGYQMDLADFVEERAGLGRDRITLDADRVEQVGSRRFRLDVTAAEALEMVGEE